MIHLLNEMKFCTKCLVFEISDVVFLLGRTMAIKNTLEGKITYRVSVARQACLYAKTLRILVAMIKSVAFYDH